MDKERSEQLEVEIANRIPIDAVLQLYGHDMNGLVLEDGRVTSIENYA